MKDAPWWIWVIDLVLSDGGWILLFIFVGFLFIEWRRFYRKERDQSLEWRTEVEHSHKANDEFQALLREIRDELRKEPTP